MEKMSKRLGARQANVSHDLGNVPAVAPAYRRAEVEAIPEDWASMTVGEIAPLQRGFDLPTTEVRTGPYPVVYSNGILRHHNRAMARAPGVITGRSGTIGKVHFVAKDYWPHNTALWVVSFLGNDPKFVYYLYAHLDLARFLSGSGVPTLNRNDVHDHHAPLPPLSEQRAIATVLSDADELIGSLEALIAKKRVIKQAAMQELLAGRTRLPGFGEEWETKRLEEVAVVTMGQSPPSASYNAVGDGLPLIQGNADIVRRTTIDRIWTTLPSKRCSAGDIVLTVRAPVGSVARASKPACLGRGVCGLEPLGHGPFLYYALILRESRWENVEQGSTFSAANSAQVAAFPIAVPIDKLEQRAIATVLSDMDTEITALEGRLDKTRAIKRGMMQQLLTGSIRLPVHPSSGEGEADP